MLLVEMLKMGEDCELVVQWVAPTTYSPQFEEKDMLVLLLVATREMSDKLELGW